jgi:hypothetical protein
LERGGVAKFSKSHEKRPEFSGPLTPFYGVYMRPFYKGMLATSIYMKLILCTVSQQPVKFFTGP